jgi:hypothetical protein
MLRPDEACGKDHPKIEACFIAGALASWYNLPDNVLDSTGSDNPALLFVKEEQA